MLGPGTHTVTVSRTGYLTKKATLTTTFGSVGTFTANMVATPKILRFPTSSRLTYRRRGGVARFSLSGKFRTADIDMPPMSGRRVYLQSSLTGTGGWKNTYALTTNRWGYAKKYFRVKTARTRYYRWYIPAKSGVNTKAYSSKWKVRVR